MGTNLNYATESISIAFSKIKAISEKKQVKVELQLGYFTWALPPPTNIKNLSCERHRPILVLKHDPCLLVLWGVPRSNLIEL